jgi:DUF4097 and DUF4098 domain-containing protein YvlB
MKIAAPLALLLGASGLMALQPKPTLNCDDQHRDSRRATFCEIREDTVASAGAVIGIDARQNGGISLKGWDRGDVLVRSQIRTTAATDAEARDLARQVIVHSAGAQIRADGPTSERDRYWSVSYEVFVPTHSSASLQTVNGGINVNGVSGNLDFKAVNGGVTLRGVSGSVQGRTTNGGVHIELAGDRWVGNGMDVTTTNGGVTIRVPQNFSAQLEAETQNGGIHSDLPLEPPPTGRAERRVSAAIGSGGATLKVRTTNGGVTIKRI